MVRKEAEYDLTLFNTTFVQKGWVCSQKVKTIVDGFTTHKTQCPITSPRIPICGTPSSVLALDPELTTNC